MGRHMTSWTLNMVFAALAAATFFFPSPSEIRGAIEYGQYQLQMEPSEPAASRRPQTVAFAPVASPASPIETGHINCLQDYNTRGTQGVSDCLPSLVSQISRFDEAAKKTLGHGLSVYPNPDIENMRLAVAELCRDRWVSQGTQPAGQDFEQCRSVLVGIDY